MTITIRGIHGIGTVTIDLAEWESLSPCGKVLAIHAARRDLTGGKPFEILREARA